MNKEQQELLDVVYKKYQTEMMFHPEDNWLEELDGMNMSTGERKKVYRQYAPVEFINKCKTDTEFSEKWGLKIEERELSLGERTEYKKKRDGISRTFAPYTHQMLDGSNIPTKLITITYNDTKLESYE
jgi:hypothetical protein